MAAAPALGKGPAYTDPAKADADFDFQGEYVGEMQGGGKKIPLGIQVIALGKGQFQAVAYRGGLPGDGWNGEAPMKAEGSRDGDRVVFKAEGASVVLQAGTLHVEHHDGAMEGDLKKVMRTSKTLGQKPPAGAVVLFDGSGVEHWSPGKLSEQRELMQGATSKPKFGSHRLHLEFRLPYQPEDRGQARGNSGIYLQGRYEVQMLDSFGLSGEHNECGGIYELKKPDLNMCYPPLSWQTYDIEFTAAKFDAEGKMTTKPTMTVYHNGVKIHDQVELPRSTRAAPGKPGPEPGPVYLQDHGNPVRYRNIWVVPHE